MKTKKYIYNYITTNLIDGKQYVGMHSTDNLDDGYLGSGIYFLKALKKYGKESFEKEILCICETLEEASINESIYIRKYDTMKPKGYNLNPFGGTFLGSYASDETKLKMSKSRKGSKNYWYGKKLSEEHKIKISEFFKGASLKEETKQKISKANKGQKRSELIKNKISNSLKGKIFTEEHKNNIGKSNKGRIFTEESRKKIGEASKKMWEARKLQKQL